MFGVYWHKLAQIGIFDVVLPQFFKLKSKNLLVNKC